MIGKMIVVLIVVRQVCAMDMDDQVSKSDLRGDEVINMSDVLPQSMPTDITPIDYSHKVNLNENVPGCMDDYFRCTRNFWLIAEGWIDLAATATSAASTTLIAVSTQGNLDEDERSKLGKAALVLNSLSGFLMVLKAFSLKGVQSNEKKLAKIIEENHTFQENPMKEKNL